MNAKRFSLSDVVVLKDNDKLATDQLNGVRGGGSCVCSSGNCNSNTTCSGNQQKKKQETLGQ